MPRKPPTAPNLELLLSSWQLSLRADRKSQTTVKTYSEGVRFYLLWCAEQAYLGAIHTASRITA